MKETAADFPCKGNRADSLRRSAAKYMFSLLLLISLLPRSLGLRDLKKATYTVEHRYPHEKKCFSEGLLINGSSREVFESCGLYGKSYIKKMSLDSGKVLQRGAVPKEIFSEGIALLGRRLFMLTYKKKQVLEYDVHTFKVTRRHPFPYGEGWGLTTDGCDLLATTGSPNIYRLRLDASGELQLVKTVTVVHKGKKINMLNEMEYITPKVWINQWHTNFLLRVDPDTGKVDLQLDLTGLHTWRGEATPNGIAYSAAMDEGLLIATGKLWPQMFALRVSAADLCGAEVAHVGAKGSPLTCAAAPRSACHHPLDSVQPAPSVPDVVGVASPTSAPLPTAPPAPAVAVESTVPPLPAQSPSARSSAEVSGKTQPAPAGKSEDAAIDVVRAVPPAPVTLAAVPDVIVEGVPVTSNIASSFTALSTGLALVLFFAAVALPCVVRRHRHALGPIQQPDDCVAERYGA